MRYIYRQIKIPPTSERVIKIQFPKRLQNIYIDSLRITAYYTDYYVTVDGKALISANPYVVDPPWKTFELEEILKTSQTLNIHARNTRSWDDYMTLLIAYDER